MDSVMELFIAGRIPGTQTTINFEAFLQGLLVGAITALLVKKATQLGRYIIIRKMDYTDTELRTVES